MQHQWKFGIIAVLALAAIVALGIFVRPAPGGSVSNAEDAAIRTTIADLGSRLKNVSLLSPTAASDIAAEYGAYVTPELLAQWQTKPEGAPGRQTSSPWPDRIEVGALEQIGEGEVYVAQANVVEVANSDIPGAFANMYPVTIMLEKRDGRWLISDWQKESVQEPPERISAIGYWECLPHKDTSGPQTMECALGIAIDQSDGHYAISTALMSMYPVDYQTGSRVRVTGNLLPPEPNSIYTTDGTIWATTIEPL